MAIAELSRDACVHQGWGNPAETWLQGKTFDLTIAWLNCLTALSRWHRGWGQWGGISVCCMSLPPSCDMALRLNEGSSISLGDIEQLCNFFFRFENHLWTPQGIKNLQHKAHINSATWVFWTSQNMCSLLCAGCNASLVWCGSATPPSGQVNETSQSSQFEVPVWALKSD